MHTIQTLHAQSITAERISHAAAQRAAREVSRASSPRRRKPSLHLRGARRAAPSV
jgi:hypothetical protein